MNPLPTNVMTSVTSLSWQQLNEAISLKREDLRQLEEQAAFMRQTAAATARNILRAYDISFEEITASIANDDMALGSASRKSRALRRVEAAKSGDLEQTSAGNDGGPLSRLPTTVKTVLANQGLRTFDAIAQAVDGGAALQRMGPTRMAQLDAWLRQER